MTLKDKIAEREQKEKEDREARQRLVSAFMEIN